MQTAPRCEFDLVDKNICYFLSRWGRTSLALRAFCWSAKCRNRLDSVSSALCDERHCSGTRREARLPSLSEDSAGGGITRKAHNASPLHSSCSAPCHCRFSQKYGCEGLSSVNPTLHDKATACPQYLAMHFPARSPLSSVKGRSK